MSTNAAKKAEEIQEQQHAYEYQEVYDALAELVVDPTLLLQAFTLNNNTDIIKAIEYWKNKITGDLDPRTVEINNIIRQYENVMLFRLYITQDLHTNSIPLMEQGPVGVVQTEETKVGEDTTKVIQHPASKKQTVNEKLGEKVKEETAKVEVSETFKSDYDKAYPTEEEKLEAINTFLPTIEDDLAKGNEKGALRRLGYHLKSYGDKKHFCTKEQMESLLTWIKEDKFQHVSPLNILRDVPLSITDIIKEAERLIKIEGLGEQEVKDYLKYYVLDNQLAEQKTKEDVIRTEEAYADFFQRTINFLFDEVQQTKEPVPTAEEDATVKETQENIKEGLYEIHKSQGYKCIFKIAKDLREWVKTNENKDYSLDSALVTAALFVKSKAPELYEEFDSKRSKKIGTGGGEKKTSTEPVSKEIPKESNETDGEKGKVNPITSKSIYPELEKMLIYKTKKSQLSEFLISIVNKHIRGIGDLKTGLVDQIEALTGLAKKAFLEIGVQDDENKELSDWTEQDVTQFMGEEVVPYITDEYSILKAESDKELLSELEYYMQKYPSGDEKKRQETLKIVLTSEVPRSNFMKPIAKKVRKGDFADFNNLFKELSNKQLENQKEEVKT